MQNEEQSGTNENADSAETALIGLVDGDQVELATFAPYAQTGSIDRLPDLSPSSIGQFNQLFGSAPALTSMSAASSEQLVLCNLDFDRLIEAKDGAGSLGIVRKPASHQFGEHVRLNKPEELRRIVTTGMIFNIVSTLVAQQHLAEINKKLDLIQKGVKKIADYQQNERASTIGAAHGLIQLTIDRLARGESVSEVTIQRLSQNLSPLEAIAGHLERDFNSQCDDLRTLDVGSMFGSNDIRDNIRKAIKSTAELHTQYMLSMQCLVMSNAILFYVRGFDGEFREHARHAIARLDAKDGVTARWAAYQKQVRVKLHTMRPLFEFARSTAANITLAEKAVSQADRQLSEERGHLSHIASMLLSQDKNTRVVLTVRDGAIVGGKILG